MTTWRDIADQLTPTQIGYLEDLERDPLPGGLLAGAQRHLSMARGWARENLEQCLHGVQYTDGRLETRLALSGEGLKDLRAGTAREVAAALLEAVEG